jgi:hypothetical protein
MDSFGNISKYATQQLKIISEHSGWYLMGRSNVIDYILCTRKKRYRKIKIKQLLGGWRVQNAGCLVSACLHVSFSQLPTNCQMLVNLLLPMKI